MCKKKININQLVQDAIDGTETSNLEKRVLEAIKKGYIGIETLIFAVNMKTKADMLSTAQKQNAGRNDLLPKIKFNLPMFYSKREILLAVTRLEKKGVLIKKGANPAQIKKGNYSVELIKSDDEGKII